MLNIKKTDSRLDKIAEINDICEQNESLVYILGGTYTGKKIAKYLVDNGLESPIQFVVDDEFITDEQKDNGVIPFSTYLEKYAKLAPLVFGFFNYEIILKKRERYKNIISHMYDFHITVVNNARLDWNYEYVMEHYSEFCETYMMLSDERSKKVMQAYLDAAVGGDFHSLYSNYKDNVLFFDEKLLDRKIDRFFDCGAFDGDSAHDFVSKITDYDKIYEFEPDVANIEKIRKRVVSEGIRDLEIINKGVWSETQTLYFKSEGNSGSAISNDGDVKIDVIKLDDMYESVTSKSMIKMDIEGSEYEALKGAQRIIREISPALAICVYHRIEDMITIPQYISKWVNKDVYDYFLSFQGLDLSELVFYAIPKGLT